MENLNGNSPSEPTRRFQYSLRTLLLIVTGSAFFLGLAKTFSEESLVGAGLGLAVAIGLGSVLYEAYRQPPS